MTAKVSDIERTSLRNPVKVQASTQQETVDHLVQTNLFIDEKFRSAYVSALASKFNGNSMIVFVDLCTSVEKIAKTLQDQGFLAVALHGQMSQRKRSTALSDFKQGEKNILVATDVAARGLDIPSVDIVINWDVPKLPKEYIHRVGRTARAGRSGRSITLVTQYTLVDYLRIEIFLGKQLPAYTELSEQGVEKWKTWKKTSDVAWQFRGRS
eukprot:gnl/MRDRNA2_/MRDRNA2_70313_c0_seq2.p1 gnl/MRDRNA2_/MRDRNA2_70313_c0~~gnl/MRDRNA2_/MRDRNA2_70313_c0_seq2.p1  ORF type:complete len:228 (+),score=37.44 gnl/MRDRNA2_/MRDRNA2_70313_c0_seq2:52-684(+)